MRESNFNSPSQNRACVCITSALYDRRAIDAPSPSLPLVNSLTHLSYLTATSPRIREILSLDGGLERLVRILKRCAASAAAEAEAKPNSHGPTLKDLKGKASDLGKGARKSPFKSFASYGTPSPDQAGVVVSPPLPKDGGLPSTYAKHLLYTYTLAFQCIVNIGVRGSEMIRTRVVEAGALDVVVHVLERYLEKINEKRNKQSPSRSSRMVVCEDTARFEEVVEIESEKTRGESPDSMDEGELETEADEATTSRSNKGKRPTRASAPPPSGPRDVDGDVVMDEDPSAPPSSPPASASPGGLQFRDEDVLLSLQLLAYLSKYPHVRSVFHSPSDMQLDDEAVMDSCDDHTHIPVASSSKPSSPLLSSSSSPTLSSNVFSLVEAFTHRPAAHDRSVARHSHEVQYWAGVIMRNACRKDENQGGIRQCANMQCGKWEVQAREFAKCRRCRKAKYCSKQCQSKAWQLGHRYWCAKATPKETSASSSSARELERGLAGSSVEDVRATRDDTAMMDHLTVPPPSSRRSRTSESSRSHHHHHHRSTPAAGGGEVGSRPSSALESNDDDDDAADENLPPPAGRLPSAMHLRHSHHRHEEFDAVVIGGGGGGVEGPMGLDENEMAQEMMGGGVFGERVNVAGD